MNLVTRKELMGMSKSRLMDVIYEMESYLTAVTENTWKASFHGEPATQAALQHRSDAFNDAKVALLKLVKTGRIEA